MATLVNCMFNSFIKLTPGETKTQTNLHLEANVYHHQCDAQTSFPQNVPSHRGETDVFAGKHNA